MRTAAPRRKEETNCMVLKCSLYSVIYIVWFCIKGRFGQYWLQKRELCKNISQWTLENALLRQCFCGRKLQIQREHKEAVLFQGDGVLATAIQSAGRAHQLYILVRGGGETIRSSLPLGFHRA